MLRVAAGLHIYTARRFLFWLICVLAVLTLLFSIVDMVELLRRAAARPQVGFAQVLQMTLAKLPQLMQDTLPFVTLFAALATFWRLTRFHEVTVMRAAGFPLRAILAGPMTVALLAGVFQLALWSPLAAALQGRFERLEAHYLENAANGATLAGTGLWLRQAHPEGQAVIHARAAAADGALLRDATVFLFDADKRFLRRIDAPLARLQPNGWAMEKALVTYADGARLPVGGLLLPGKLTTERIREGFSSPEALSFWELPGFITEMEKAGFNARSYYLRLHALYATPLILCAMVLAAAAFTLRPVGRSGLGAAVLGGLGCGLALYLMNSFIHTLGLARLPPQLAAWTPAVVSLLLGVSAILYLEDS